MVEYKSLVRRSFIEYQHIEEYVREKALSIMALDETIFNLAFTRAM